MRILLVVNAAASSVTPRVRVLIRQQLASRHEVRVAETSRQGHATRLAMGAAADGVDVVAVLGGDGTINEAANGLATTDTALAALPGGSTNVFARSVGMVNDPVKGAKQLLAALDEGSIRPVNLGKAGGRYFLCHVGLGLDAVIVENADSHPGLKRRLGGASFVPAGFTAWARDYYWRHPAGDLTAHPEAGDPVMVKDAYFAVCMNSDPYTYLGPRPLSLVPGTGLDTGLSLVVLDSLRLAVLLGVLGGAIFSSHGLEGRKHVQVLTGLDEVEVDAGPLVQYQMDGEHMGLANKLVLRSAVGAMRLVIPVGPPEGAGAGGAIGSG
ncbi:MAG: diacylglycerol/lipid kinase family protein [Acidimicrobiales bacterium]